MNRSKLYRFAAAAAVSALMTVFAGLNVCAQDNIADSTTHTAYVSAYRASSVSKGSISIPDSTVTLNKDETYVIIVDKKSDSSGDITFRSADSSIATVDNEGVVTAVGGGLTDIYCTAQDGSEVSFKVVVIEKGKNFPAERVYFSVEEYTLEKGETWHLPAMIYPSRCTYTVKYRSSDKKVAKVVKTGDVTAVGAGVCTVTITTNNGLSASIKITVIDPGSDADSTEYIKFNSDSISLGIGEKTKPGIMAYPDGADYSISYSSADPSVAEVSAGGTITGVGDGITTVTASCGAMYDTIEVVVGTGLSSDDQSPNGLTYDENGRLLPSRLEFAHSSDSVEVGEDLYPGVKIYPKGSVYELTYTSSDENVAVVSEKGKVTAVGEGTAVITVLSQNGLKDSFFVTVYKEKFSGIDISKWQGDIDWEAVSNNPDIDFVMIRATYGQDDVDKKLNENVAGCEEYGIPYGFYHYIYAENTDEAEIEADNFLNAISGYSPTYPVVLDIEESFYQKMDKDDVTDIVCTFMEKLEDRGYYAMIYSFAKFIEDELDYERIKVYDIWVACWGDRDRLNENFSYSYGMWQYSEKGTVEGIEEYVDLDYSYKNYPFIIRKFGLNGTSSSDYNE